MEAQEALGARGPGSKAARLGTLVAVILLILLTVAPPAQAELEFLTQWGAPGPGELIAPIDVERDSAGNTYVVDAFTRSVVKYDSAGNFVLRWGRLGNGPGEFQIPSAIGINATTGHVYVGDIGGRVPSDVRARIHRFDSNGNFLDQFGSFGTAEGQFGGFIRGIAVHPSSQDVFVAEGQRIQRFSASGQFERMWGKDVQAGNPSTDAETCTSGCKAGVSGTLGGEFASPSAVAASGFGVFVSEDGNKRVQRFTVDGTFQLAGGRDVLQGGGAGHEVCSVAANCKAGISGTGNGELDEPGGIDVDTDAVAPHNVYIVDRGNSRVQNWDVGLNYLGQFGSAGSGDGQFQVPIGLAESQGSVAVTDLGLYRVQRFAGGAFQARFGEPGQATLVVPEGIGTGPGGIYVTDDRDRVLRFDPGGGFLGAFGSEGTAPGQFVRPAGLAGDPAGNVYVADRGNYRIQRFDANGAALGAWGAFGSGPGEFDDPRDVAVGPGGEVYVIENGNNSRIQKFNQIGAFMGTWGAPGTAPGQFSGDGIATDPQGNVYVADTANDRIQVFDPNGNLLNTWGTPGTGNGEFDSPADVAVDGLGNVYVVDRNNNRIQRFASNGTFLGRWGASGGDGTFGEGPGEFFNPSAIAVDAARDIYVLDNPNSRVQKFAAASAPDPSRLVPDLRLGGRKRQDSARLRVKVDCGGPPCDVRIGGKVIARPTAGGKSERIEGLTRVRKASSLKRKLKPKTLDLTAGEEATVRLKLRRQRSSVRIIKSALARGAKGKAVIRATAKNDAGSDAAALRVKLKR